MICTKCEKAYDDEFVFCPYCGKKNATMMRDRQKEYYRNNREHYLARNREWMQSHKEQRAAYMREYNEKNRERIKEYYKVYNKKHRSVMDSDNNRTRYNRFLDDLREKESLPRQDFFDVSTASVGGVKLSTRWEDEYETE